MKRSLPILRRDKAGGRSALPATGSSLLAGARRRLAELKPLPATVRVHVRCRPVRPDGFVTAALRRYQENDGSYVPNGPEPTVNRQV